MAKRIKRGDKITTKILNSLGGGNNLSGGKDVLVSDGSLVNIKQNASDRKFFYGKIISSTGITAIGDAGTEVSNNQWTYQFNEVVKSTTGYVASTWRTPLNKKSGTCYNWAEIPNSPSGEQGNGVNIDPNDPDVTITLKAIPGNRVVPMFDITLDDGKKEYWFDMLNGIVVDCSAASAGPGTPGGP